MKWPMSVCLVVWASCAVEASELRDVSLRSLPDGATEVLASFSAEPAFYYYFVPDPVALVLAVSARGAARTYAHTSGHVRGIRVESAEGEELRIVVELNGTPDVSVKAEGRAIRVSVRAVEEERAPPAPERVGSPPSMEWELVPAVPAPIRDLHVRRVVLDPGHGGWDSGAVSRDGLQEKDVNLAIALKTEALIREHTDVEVHLTRRGDYYVPLRERVLIANQYRADLFVSLHCNASTKASMSGTEVYFCSEEASDREAALVAQMENAVAREEEESLLPPNYVDIEDILFRFERKLYWEDSRRIAEALQGHLVSAMGTADRGVKSANFSVLRNAKMPAILLEIAFLSNGGDVTRLRQEGFQWRAAKGMLEAIRRLRG